MNRAFSFGGGRQSTAALVLAAQGELDVDVFVFANVGDDSENPDTIAYMRDHVKPYAEKHGIELVEVQRRFRDGRGDTLLTYTQKMRAIPIPVKDGSSGIPFKRVCTVDWKINVVSKYLKVDRQWPVPYEMQLGISWDEAHRARDPELSDEAWGYRRAYPLLQRKLTAVDCTNLVVEAGLPRPPKSSCWFCPFHDRSTWAKMRLNRADLFSKAVALERDLSERRVDSGRPPVYLTNRLKPLDVAIPQGAEQIEMFEDDGGACTSGYCWT